MLSALWIALIEWIELVTVVEVDFVAAGVNENELSLVVGDLVVEKRFVIEFE